MKNKYENTGYLQRKTKPEKSIKSWNKKKSDEESFTNF